MKRWVDTSSDSKGDLYFQKDLLAYISIGMYARKGGLNFSRSGSEEHKKDLLRRMEQEVSEKK